MIRILACLMFIAHVGALAAPVTALPSVAGGDRTCGVAAGHFESDAVNTPQHCERCETSDCAGMMRCSVTSIGLPESFAVALAPILVSVSNANVVSSEESFLTTPTPPPPQS